MPIRLVKYRCQITAYILLAVAASMFAGCGGDGPRLGEVKGVVTLDGQPLTNARVVFHIEGARDSYAFTDENGQYELTYLRDKKGAVIGRHHVSITMANSDGTAAQQKLAPVEVHAGKNVFNFDI